MKGFDALERHAFEVVNSGGDANTANAAAVIRLLERGIFAFGPDKCPHCGRHPTLIVTPLGREVQRLDLLSRGLL